MDIIGAKHPFYEVAWRRYATVWACFGWALFECLVARSPFWGVLAVGVTGMAAWELILNYKPKVKEPDHDPKP
jgi:hypothetical protein